MRTAPPRLTLAALALASSLAFRAEAQTTADLVQRTEASIVQRTEMDVVWPRGTPYAGEMVLLRLRSAIKAPIALYEMRQPPLADFDWQQFGRDQSFEAEVDGFTVPGIERMLAIFPRRAGGLVIQPFSRHVTLLGDGNRRVEADFGSAPLPLAVADPAALAGPAGSWLPASGLTLREAWEPDPARIGPGETVRRTITLDAAGTTAEHLPPALAMAAPGILAFAAPAERETEVTENGPVAHATYRWELGRDPGRHGGGRPTAPAVRVAWFDTAAREMREAVLPERPLGSAYVRDTGPGGTEGPAFDWRALVPHWPVAAGGFAWLLTLAAWLASWDASPPLPREDRRALAALRRAARAGDARRFRSATASLARASPARWASVRRGAAAPDLAALDRTLFGRPPNAPPDLRRLAKDIRIGWRAG